MKQVLFIKNKLIFDLNNIFKFFIKAVKLLNSAGIKLYKKGAINKAKEYFLRALSIK